MIENERKYWSDLLYNLTKGDAVQMSALRGFDTFDFFRYVESFKARQGNGR